MPASERSTAARRLRGPGPQGRSRSPRGQLAATARTACGLLSNAAEEALRSAEMEAGMLQARMLVTSQDFDELRELACDAVDFDEFLREERKAQDQRTARTKCLAQCACVLGNGDPAGLVHTWLSDASGAGRPTAHKAVGKAVKERLCGMYQDAGKAKSGRDVLDAVGEVMDEVQEQEGVPAETKRLVRRVPRKVKAKNLKKHGLSLVFSAQTSEATVTTGGRGGVVNMALKHTTYSNAVKEASKIFCVFWLMRLQKVLPSTATAQTTGFPLLRPW